MKRLSIIIVLLLPFIAACATHPDARPAALPPPEAAVPAVAVPSNGLTPLATAPRAIEEPRIRVGMLSDQTAVTFPRIAGGYVIVTAAGPSSLKRGFSVS